LLPGYHRNVQKQVATALQQYGVELITDFRVSRVTKNAIESTSGNTLSIDQSIWCTPATAPAWPALAGLDTDENGFGLIGHVLETLKGTLYSVKITTANIALISGALELSRQGVASTLMPQLIWVLDQCDTDNIDAAMT
jgi:hypothetical protein